MNEELTIDQQNALLYCLKKSHLFSKNVLPNLEAKMNSKGYVFNDILKIYDYLKNKVNVIIHVNLEKALNFLCKDDFYRNQFEVNTRREALSPPTRIIWENNLFNNIYQNTSGFDKVKYGVLNLTNDPRGVNSAYGYGDSYLVLKDENKYRITFVFGDSSQQDFHIATFDHFYHILYYIDDNLLNNLIKLSKGEIIDYKMNNYTYIEAQIHGPFGLKKILKY